MFKSTNCKKFTASVTIQEIQILKAWGSYYIPIKINKNIKPQYFHKSVGKYSYYCCYYKLLQSGEKSSNMRKRTRRCLYMILYNFTLRGTS